MKIKLTVADISDFCLFLIYTCYEHIFSRLQYVISICDPVLFCIICVVLCYAVTWVIRHLGKR